MEPSARTIDAAKKYVVSSTLDRAREPAGVRLGAVAMRYAKWASLKTKGTGAAAGLKPRAG
jgi:hypothetical protein